jgi:hypothetical protein
MVLIVATREVMTASVTLGKCRIEQIASILHPAVDVRTRLASPQTVHAIKYTPR